MSTQPQTLPQNTIAAVKKGKGKKAKTAKGKKGKKAANAVPSRMKTPLNQGVYISSSRTKFWIDNNGLNKDIEQAIEELRNGEPHEHETKGVKKMTGLRPLVDMSPLTQKLVKQALTQFDTREKAKTVKRDKDIKEGKLDVKKEAEENKVKAAEKVKKDAERKDKGQPVRGPKKVSPFSKEIECLSKMRIRFSKEAAPQVAGTICAAMHELMNFGMENVMKDGRKILKRRHILKAGVEQLSLSSLYCKLTNYRNAQLAEAKRTEDESKKREEKKAAKALAADTKEVKVETKVETKAEVKAEPVVAHEEDEEEDDGEGDDEEDEYDVRNFRHYIKQVCHNVMNHKILDEKKLEYDQIRVSREVREFGSELIIEFIRMLCPLLLGQIQSQKVKTVNEDVIKQTVSFMLMIVNVDHKLINANIELKLKDYRTWVEKKKAEKAEKEKAEALKAEAEAKAKAAADAAESAKVEAKAEAKADDKVAVKA